MEADHKELVTELRDMSQHYKKPGEYQNEVIAELFGRAADALDTPAEEPRAGQQKMTIPGFLRQWADEIEKEDKPIDGVLMLGYTRLDDSKLEGQALTRAQAGLSTAEQVHVCQLFQHNLFHTFKGALLEPGWKPQVLDRPYEPPAEDEKGGE